MPHHVTQLGNRRQPTFFGEEDCATYLELMGHWCQDCGVEIWAYCLMPTAAGKAAWPRVASAEAGSEEEIETMIT
jgi:putative transposase